MRRKSAAKSADWFDGLKPLFRKYGNMKHPQESWNEAGMSFSFLGREICRPTNPQCEKCDLRAVCSYNRAVRKPG